MTSQSLISATTPKPRKPRPNHNAARTAQRLRAPHKATREVAKRHGDSEAKDLYRAYDEYNRSYWAKKLGSPFVMITQTKSARTLGDYIGQDPIGLKSRIRIAGATVARGSLFARDVLLHEMVHAWQTEILTEEESGYRGHGPKFAEECNRIGKKLGLPPVGVKGRGKLPDCSYWPMNVRPPGYYGTGDFEEPTRKAKALSPVEKCIALLVKFEGPADFEALALAVEQEVERRATASEGGEE